MRILTIIFLFIIHSFYSQEIESIWIINKSKKSNLILTLFKGNNYRLVEFLKSTEPIPISKVDTGLFILREGVFKKITFKSTVDNKSPLNRVTLYIHNRKLWEKPHHPFFKAEYKAIRTEKDCYKKVPHVEVKGVKEIKEDYIKNFFLVNIEKYSPSYLPLIKESYCGPGCYFKVGAKEGIDTLSEKLMADYTTVIHETIHSWNHNPIYDSELKFRTERLFIHPGISITYRVTGVFPSELILGLLSPDAPDKIFRLKTYIGKGATPSSNSGGIWGLMNEFSAYRNGTGASIEALRTAIRLGDRGLIEVFSRQVVGQYFAYWEFRLFISLYLEYAKMREPVVFKEIMDNVNLRIAFTLIDDGFRSDIVNSGELLKKCQNSGFSSTEKIWTEYVRGLNSQHESPLQEFRIEVNKANYKEKLK